MGKPNAAYQFEKSQRLHETRKTKGIVNRLTPPQWRIYQEDKVNRRTIEIVGPLIQNFERPVVLAIGAGGGGLLRLAWNGPNIKRIGVDINHDVLVNEGRNYFDAVEGSAYPLPIRDESADIVLFDYVLHHLVGQGVMEDAICEGMRVLRQGGYLVAREPSSLSPSGFAVNIANKFRLMNALTGSSNYEFALSPAYLLKVFQREGSVVAVRGLSYLWSRRLPIWAQAVVGKLEPFLTRSPRGHWLADFILYIVRKDQ